MLSVEFATAPARGDNLSFMPNVGLVSAFLRMYDEKRRGCKGSWKDKNVIRRTRSVKTMFYLLSISVCLSVSFPPFLSHPLRPMYSYVNLLGSPSGEHWQVWPHAASFAVAVRVRAS